MNRLTLLAVLFFVFASSMAKAESGRHRFRVFGNYNYGSVSPSDVNSGLTNFTPAPSSFTSFTNYGGGIGIMFGPKFEGVVSYRTGEAKSLNSSNNGLVINLDEVWAGLNYYLINQGKFHVYVGAAAGLPITEKITTQISGTNTVYTADKGVDFKGALGGALMLGQHFSLGLEVAYESITTTASFKNSSNTFLFKSNGTTKAALDLSGVRGSAYLSFLF